MKKIIFILIFVFSCVVTNAQDTFKVNGDNYSAVSNRSGRSSTPEKTGKTWTDSKGNQYPIYISASGSCFIIKTSNKTGKEYRSYLKPEVSEDICKKLGREYRGKKDKS